MNDLKLDVSIFDENHKNTSIGVLDNDKIKFILNKKPELKSKLNQPRTIMMWSNRLGHIEKHRDDFRTGQFDEMVENIPEIIKYPDYIGVRPNTDSLQFIKRYSENILVAVRIELGGGLSFRTFYPITDSQIEDYIAKDKLWKYHPFVEKYLTKRNN